MAERDKVTITLHKNTIAGIDALATKQNRTRSNMIDSVLAEYLQKAKQRTRSK